MIAVQASSQPSDCTPPRLARGPFSLGAGHAPRKLPGRSAMCVFKRTCGLKYSAALCLQSPGSSRLTHPREQGRSGRISNIAPLVNCKIGFFRKIFLTVVLFTPIRHREELRDVAIQLIKSSSEATTKQKAWRKGAWIASCARNDGRRGLAEWLIRQLF